MTNLIVFQLDGDFTSGFQITLEAFLADNIFDGRKLGKLPREPQLLEALKTWQQEYRNWGSQKRIKIKKVVHSTHSPKNLKFYGQKLIDQFQSWLRSPIFQELNAWINSKINDQESTRILISANNQKLHQLPWHQWEVIQDRPNIAIVLSKLDSKGNPRERKQVIQVSKSKSQVRILAIFGNSQNINVSQDLVTLKTLKNTYLKPLFEPGRDELYEYLWDESWDIIFFAGHSETINQQGIIHLNSQEILSINDLQYAFQKAIVNGLKLAIFNSCDGLGLAYALGELSIPQLIVMREPIIDGAAHQFLDFFIREYSSGQPLHLATRKARERLQALEREYPFCSWLPVLYQNQASVPISWSELISPPKKKFLKLSSNHYIRYVLMNFVICVLSWLLSSLGFFQSLELKNYDLALSLKPLESQDKRILVVTVDDQDIAYQEQRQMIRKGSLSDQALAELIAKIKPYQPIAIASDIIHDFPYEAEFSQAILKQNNFLTICRIKINKKYGSLNPPPQFDIRRIAFSNIAIDDDGVIRRHIVGMAPGNKCQSQVSLGFKMALEYLDHLAQREQQQKSYPRKLIEDKVLKIGTLSIPKLSADSGAYQIADQREDNGFKILLNARNQSPQSISLRKLLQETSEQQLASLISKKIIFIGVDSINGDRYYIAGNKSLPQDKVPGVFVHAEATSQILSAILDQRKLIRWSANWFECIWIIMWCLIGLGIVWLVSLKPLHKNSLALIVSLNTAIALCILYSIFLGLLIFNSYWIPVIAPALTLVLSATGNFWLKSQNHSKLQADLNPMLALEK